jgi:hypothetical protein
MRMRTGLAISALVATGVLLSAQSAAAATVVGNPCVGNDPNPEATLINLGNGSTSMPSAIPTSGVITSWTFTVVAIPSGELSMELKVFRPTGIPAQFQVVGESPLTPVNGGVNTFQTRIPVQAGDLLGETGVAPIEETGLFAVSCGTTNPGDKIGAFAGNPTTGSSATLGAEASEFAVPVTATVEPDADGDGFGDETQDKCPTNASTQGPCPAPPPIPAPITLSASAAAQKGLVTVTLTSSAQASITVGGTVKLGKGKSATLSGGTQIVAPGTLAKFTVLFPAKLKARLKQLTPKQKLTLSLSASAPGATGTALTVKVKGQKSKSRHQKK